MTDRHAPWRRRAHRAFRTAAVLGLLCGGGEQAVAQTESGADGAPVRVGRVRLAPRITLGNIGVDTNVFNEAEDPKQDTTATVSPALDAVVRLGPARLSANGSADLIYFREFTNLRTFNWSADGRLDWRLGRVTPHVQASALRASERPSLEVDLRARRVQESVGAGLDVDLGAKTTLRASALRTRTTFDENAAFLGVRLADTLAGSAEDVNASIVYQASPLTRFSASVGRQRDRFDVAVDRDSTSERAIGFVEFAATALVSGQASVGVKRFDIAAPGVEDFTGVIASVDLTYRFRERTRVGVGGARDVMYSFSPTEPYFVMTGVQGSVSQRIGQAWELTVSAGRQHLAYRRQAGALAALAGDGTAGTVEPRPNGFVEQAGAAIRHYVGRRLTIGFHGDLVRRFGEARSHYRGLRIYSAITYGR